eukprot:637600-Prymnesium_polylepis.1
MHEDGGAIRESKAREDFERAVEKGSEGAQMEAALSHSQFALQLLSAQKMMLSLTASRWTALWTKALRATGRPLRTST